MAVSQFSAPIPGQSLTSKPSERRWERPPEYSTTEEAMQFYMKHLTKPDVVDDMMVALGVALLQDVAQNLEAATAEAEPDMEAEPAMDEEPDMNDGPAMDDAMEQPELEEQPAAPEGGGLMARG